MSNKVIRLISIFTLILFMIVSLPGCNNNQNPAVENDDTPEEAKIALIYPLSGAAAGWGIPLVRAFEMGVDKVNNEGGFTVGGKNYKWKIVTYDSKFTTQDTVAGTNWAINDQKALIVSTLGTGATAAVAPLVEQAGILNVSIGSVAPQLPPKEMPSTFLGAYPTTQSTWIPMLRWFSEEKEVTTIASLNTEDAVGDNAKETIKSAADSLGLEVLSNELVPADTTDYYPVLTNIIAKNPDMIMTGALGSQPAALILKQARELGYEGIVFLSWGPDTATVGEIAGQYLDGAYGCAMSTPDWVSTESQRDLAARYSEKWDIKEADQTIINYGNMMLALTEAVEEADSFEASKVAAAFESKTWSGFDENDLGWGSEDVYGIKRVLEPPNNFIISQYQNGEPVELASVKK